ncbi:MAG: ParB/RepB/Spo0J family partition protein [Clostridia bacterium]|nr:ParB/RepB/Spo0J family partition protein [Clostridia bacterium]
MADKKRQSGLGRGLDSIFLDNNPLLDGIDTGSSKPLMLRLSEMEPRLDQPRKTFDASTLSALADSIAANGLIQPIVVRSGENGIYQIVAGERRWRASKMAGLTEVPVIIMQLDDRKTAELALIENLQREDLNAVEEAEGYRALIDEYGLTQEELSRRIGKSRSAVTNALRLLDLPEKVLKMLVEKSISAGHARALLGLAKQEDMVSLAEQIVKKGLSVRAVESTVKLLNAKAKKGVKEEDAPVEDEIVVDYTAELERSLTESLGRRVRIFNSNPKKPKTLTIEYTDNDDLDEIIKLLTNK